MIKKLAQWINEGKIQPPSYLYCAHECNKRLTVLIIVTVMALAICVDLVRGLPEH
ncbi:MAG: hypothetical protein ACLQF0_17035 [Dissulfurispiraceae bacterium]